MIFWGAPAHLIGGGGIVKTASPPLKERSASRVRVALVVGVVADDAVVAEVPFEPVDRRPVDRQADRDNQIPVADAFPAGQGDGVRLRVEAGDAVVDPGRAVGDDVLFAAATGLVGHDAGADEGPGRLVVVVLGRLDNRDVGASDLAAEPCSDGDPAGSSAEDQKLVMAGRGWRSGHSFIGRGVGGTQTAHVAASCSLSGARPVVRRP